MSDKKDDEPNYKIIDLNDDKNVADAASDEELHDWIDDTLRLCMDHLKYVESMEEDGDAEALNVLDYNMVQVSQCCLVLYSFQRANMQSNNSLNDNDDTDDTGVRH